MCQARFPALRKARYRSHPEAALLLPVLFPSRSRLAIVQARGDPHDYVATLASRKLDQRQQSRPCAARRPGPVWISIRPVDAELARGNLGSSLGTAPERRADRRRRLVLTGGLALFRSSSRGSSRAGRDYSAMHPRSALATADRPHYVGWRRRDSCWRHLMWSAFAIRRLGDRAFSPDSSSALDPRAVATWRAPVVRGGARCRRHARLRADAPNRSTS